MHYKQWLHERLVKKASANLARKCALPDGLAPISERAVLVPTSNAADSSTQLCNKCKCDGIDVIESMAGSSIPSELIWVLQIALQQLSVLHCNICRGEARTSLSLSDTGGLGWCCSLSAVGRRRQSAWTVHHAAEATSSGSDIPALMSFETAARTLSLCSRPLQPGPRRGPQWVKDCTQCNHEQFLPSACFTRETAESRLLEEVAWHLEALN